MREDQGGAAFVSNGSTSLGGGGASFGKHKRAVPGAEAAEEGVPGATAADGDENLSKAALKNKKKREAKKEKAKETGPTDGSKNGLDSVTELPSSGGYTNHDKRSPERRERRGNRSRTNSELRPRSQNRSRNPSQRGDSHAPRGGAARANGTTPAKPANVISPPANITSPAATTASPEVATPASAASGSSSAAATTQEKKVRALTKKLRAIDDLKMRAASGEKLEGTQLKKMETEESVRKELDGLGWSDG
jgi:translation initiation factor 2A